MKNKRSRKIFYEITRMDGYFYCGRRLGWVNGDLLDAINYSGRRCASSHRTAKTLKQAKKIINNLPSGSIILRWFYKRGIRYMREYIKT